MAHVLYTRLRRRQGATLSGEDLGFPNVGNEDLQLWKLRKACLMYVYISCVYIYIYIHTLASIYTCVFTYVHLSI